MPGIAGIVGATLGRGAEAHVETMIGVMRHEPFYRSGRLVNEQPPLQIGWTAIEGTFADCMPAWNEKRDVCLIFTGEHFAEDSEYASLRANGHHVCTENATALVHLYEEHGPRFLEKLNGCFSGLLLDLREGQVLLFTDRYGMNRIYYHEGTDGFYFASEAKALLKVLPVTRSLDYRGLGELFCCGCVLQNRTLFAEVSLLPCGSVWRFPASGGVTKAVYFDKRRWECQPQLSLPEYYEKLKETFARVLPRYLAGKARVGMSLTGGLDSRMIMAWAARGPNDLPCITHSGIYRDCHDCRIGAQVAEICRQRHHVIRADGTFLAEFPDLAEQSVYYTDGAMDVTGAVGLFVNRLARRIAPVRLTGNYGGEILRRLVAFKPGRFQESFLDAGFARYLEDAIRVYAAEKEGSILSFIAFKQVPWHHYARCALEQTQLTIRSPYLDNELAELAFRAPCDLCTNRHIAARLIADGNSELGSLPTDRGPLGRSGPLGGVGEAWREFTFKTEYAYDYGMPQWLARIDHLVSWLHLEKVFLGRHKYYHFRVWYRDQLAGYVRSVLLDARTLGRPYLKAKAVERIVSAHVNGTGNYTSEIHKLLTTEIIQRTLIECA